jgi:asparagine synthase (glutamine-hydrolysing)
MRSFFAMLWDPEDTRAAACAALIRRAVSDRFPLPGGTLECDGFLLADLETGTGPPAILPLPGEDGAPIGAFYGTVFHANQLTNAFERLGKIPAQLARSVSASDGAAIIDAVWGNFVFFLGNGRRGCVISEPAGSIPCHYASQDGVTLVFSHLEHCTFLDLRRFTLNLDFVRRLLIYDKLQNGETGLNEVRELIGGQRLKLGPGGAQTDDAWNPASIALKPLSLAPGDASAALRDCAHRVVRAHTACHGRILVDLSGGFDSSAVLALACEAGPDAEIVPVHQTTSSLDLPEVRYAQAAASHCGRNLIELVLDPVRSLPRLQTHPLSVRPYRQFIGLNLTDDMQAAGLAGFDATFTGQGGDHLFHAAQNPLVFADHLHHRGISKSMGAELLAACRLSGRSVWSVLGESTRSLAKAQAGNGLLDAIERRRSRFRDVEAVKIDLAASLPEWARTASGLPPAKFSQVTSLVHLFQVREPLPRSWSQQTIHPLISQPLIELCLRLPSYVLTAGGQSRGLARQAFSGILPDLIRRRMSKGDTSHQFAVLMDANRGHLSDALGTGHLVAEGILESGAITRTLRQEHFLSDPFGRTLLVAYAMEAWLRAWKANQVPQAWTG